MADERGEIQKRLDAGLCPWCMSEIVVIKEHPLTRQCVHCRGTIVDHEVGDKRDNHNSRSVSEST